MAKPKQPASGIFAPAPKRRMTHAERVISGEQPPLKLRKPLRPSKLK